MNEVTRVLSAIEQGDPLAAEQLLPLVYDELRRLAAHKLAQEQPGQTLDATAHVFAVSAVPMVLRGDPRGGDPCGVGPTGPCRTAPSAPARTPGAGAPR